MTVTRELRKQLGKEAKEIIKNRKDRREKTFSSQHRRSRTDGPIRQRLDNRP